MVRSGLARLNDAQLSSLSPESQFDLAFNAAHALSLAALRWHGYRSDNRYTVFQCLTHTIQLPAAQCRVLDQAHRKRNLAEYDGDVDIEASLLTALIQAVKEVAELVSKLGPVPES